MPASATDVFVMRFQSRCGKDVPGSDKHGRDHRPDDKPVESKRREAAECGDQHEVVWHLSVFADQDRAQKIIDKADEVTLPPKNVSQG